MEKSEVLLLADNISICRRRIQLLAPDGKTHHNTLKGGDFLAKLGSYQVGCERQAPGDRLTVPAIAALGLGLSETVPGRNPALEGFGLIAFASVFPMMTVMGYAQISQWLAQRRLRAVRAREG